MNSLMLLRRTRKRLREGQKHQPNSHGLKSLNRGVNLQTLISAFVLLVFISAILSRGDNCVLKSKDMRGTYYSAICLHNCLRICESREYQEPAQGNIRKQLSQYDYYKFDHIQFVQIWTPTPCGPGGYMRCVDPLPPYYANNFSMHGLWPAAADGRTLQSFRRPEPIPSDVFERIESRMNIWWANINSRHPSRSFWEHEWSKHGITGNWGEDGAQNYFLDGIRSRQNIDLLSILTSGGIRFNTDYTKRDIVEAIRKWLPVNNIYISCSGRPGGSFYLHEIFICLDTNLDYISCPFDSRPRRCLGDFFQIPRT